MDLELLLDALPHGSQGGDAEGQTNKRARSSAGSQQQGFDVGHRHWDLHVS